MVDPTAREILAELLHSVQSHLLFINTEETTAMQRAQRVDAAMNAARAYLAQPEPEGVTDEELWQEVGE